MKYIIIIVSFIICCVIFIPIIINVPISTNFFDFPFNIIWFLGATILGGFATFFPKKFNLGNAKAFEKLYKKTNINVLKHMSKETLKPFNTLNVRLIGILFLIIGLMGLFKYLVI